MFINKIEALLSEKKYSEINLLLVGLEEMLTMHRSLETDIFYPWFDDSLEKAERESTQNIKRKRKQIRSFQIGISIIDHSIRRYNADQY